MPAGSRFEGNAGMGTLHCGGRVDQLLFKTGAREIHAEQAGSVTVRTGAGNVSIDPQQRTYDVTPRSPVPQSLRSRGSRARDAAALRPRGRLRVRRLLDGYTRLRSSPR